jgi:hypothetical protein
MKELSAKGYFMMADGTKSTDHSENPRKRKSSPAKATNSQKRKTAPT